MIETATQDHRMVECAALDPRSRVAQTAVEYMRMVGFPPDMVADYERTHTQQAGERRQPTPGVVHRGAPAADLWAQINRLHGLSEAGLGEVLRDSWRGFNRNFFGGRLPKPEFRLEAIDGLLGRCGFRDQGRPIITLDPAALVGDKLSLRRGNRDGLGLLRYFQDTLLHEAVHVAVGEFHARNGLENQGDPHGPLFLGECQRITPFLDDVAGWARTVPEESCRWWPTSVRKKKYYRGALAAD
jgi:hypothetical protein